MHWKKSVVSSSKIPERVRKMGSFFLCQAWLKLPDYLVLHLLIVTLCSWGWLDLHHMRQLCLSSFPESTTNVYMVSIYWKTWRFWKVIQISAKKTKQLCWHSACQHNVSKFSDNGIPTSWGPLWSLLFFFLIFPCFLLFLESYSPVSQEIPWTILKFISLL